MLSTLWQQSRSLTATALVMLIAFVFSLIGLALDPRIVTAMPVWLKPAKFAISTAIFAASIAWLFRYLPDFPKTKRFIGPALSFILILEVGIIDFQAARGTTSHFNVSTPQNIVLFAIMGTAIGILWLLSVWLLVALFRQPFQDRAWGWTLRLALLISVLGSGSGGLMTTPTPAQRAVIAQHQRPSVIGAHTVGAPDGGPGLPALGWSTRHGDLRIPHFIGMHALQIIPLLAWWARRKRTVPFVFSISASYFVLYLILLFQALAGESITEPSNAALAALAIWFVATLAALIPFNRRADCIEAVS